MEPFVSERAITCPRNVATYTRSGSTAGVELISSPMARERALNRQTRLPLARS